MQSLRDVTVVVVTRDSAHCLESLHALLSRCEHVIVSDNASGDGTADQARDRWPQARVLRHTVNLGFGAANNRALAQVRTTWALLLNPDCVLTTSALEALVKASVDMPDAAIVAPQLVGPKGRKEVNYRWPQTVWRSTGPGAGGPACVGFVCGAAMLFRLSAFTGVGFFDEAFFLYYEDDDLCLRLFQQQRPMVVVPGISATHLSRGSVRGGSPWRSEYTRGFHHAQSKLIFVSRHRSLADALRLRHRLIALTVLSLPFRVLAFSPRLIARMWGRLRGLLQWQRPRAPALSGGVR
ncbi:MAG: glycosyltransferase family 2 protein [Gammaproteobacteria bacterium]